MKQDFDYGTYIERYLDREMEPDERIWFEKEVEGNSTLESEISLRRKVNSVLSDKEVVELKLQLDKIHKEIFEVTEKGKGTIKKIYRRVYLTATTLAVFVVLFSVFMSNRSLSNERLIDLHYQPYKSSESFRSIEKSEETLNMAMELYRAERFAEAIPLFESLLSKDNSKIGLNLYAGIAHVETKNFGEANKKFNKIIEYKPNPFVESATWYLGLSYIMTGERIKAKKYFEELSGSEGFYTKDAKKILKRIK